MKRPYIIAALLFAATPAFAQQQQVDPAFLQRALGAVQAQRNQAMDAVAAADARLSTISDDLAKAQARIKELEQPKPDAPAPAEK